jgi:hypothetical protein
MKTPSRRRRLVPGAPTRRKATQEPKREPATEQDDKELEQDLAWAWMAAGSAADRGCE